MVGYGRRCGCWTLSELEAERERHRATLEDKARYAREVQTLRDELLHVHSTVTELERRYADLSSRYMAARESLNKTSSMTTTLQEQSQGAVEDNRRLRATNQNLEDEMASLRVRAESASEAAEEERLARLALEAELSREVEAVERSCGAELRRATSTHSLDTQHLQQQICHLEAELEREKAKHNCTRRHLHQAEHLVHHRHHPHHRHHSPYPLGRSRSHSPLFGDPLFVHRFAP